MTGETRREAICLLDNSMGQIVADTRGVYLDGWPLEERRVRGRGWSRNHEAMTMDAYARALGALCMEAGR
jgi:hypothetical protein